MGKSQREKGKAGEREVAHLFRRAAYWAERTRQSRGDHDPDVRVRFGEGMDEVPLSVEVKRYSRIAALKWLDKAREDCASSKARPVVFMRQDGDGRDKWAVMLDAGLFLELLMNHPTMGLHDA